MATPKKPRKKKAPANPSSLLSPQAMGGIIAGKGFDFQTRYAACHLPLWLTEGTFQQFFFEGMGDIDVRYIDNGKSSRLHIQVKDHEVAPAELKEVVKHFQSLDANMPGVYKTFTLACPSLSAKAQPIENGLSRLRNATPFYSDVATALNPTRQEVDQRLDKAGLDAYRDFIHEKLFIEIGHGDLHYDDRALELFIARLLAHPEYAGKLRAMVQPAFAELMRVIGANKGVVLERGIIENALKQATALGAGGEKMITLLVHNWTQEAFDVPADFTLDWSKQFDRTTRKVPGPDVWNTTLVPELKALKDQIVATRSERVIRFRGKCALSTGIALGSTFPTVGGWTFEIPQPPAKDAWRSDVAVTPSYNVQVETIAGDTKGSDIVLALNIKGDGRKDVTDYVATTGAVPRLFVFISPPAQGGNAIAGPEEALSYVQAVREQLGRILKEQRVRQTRLFYYGPFALAVFLGQQLTSVGKVQLFEYQDPGYIPSVTLQT